MAAFTAIFHGEPTSQVNSLSSGLKAQAAPPTGDSSASSISSNDFLTLLVTELKNQDPTANSDPNQYVNQLVQVNSLQQLIQINQTLTDSFGSASGGSTSTSAARAALQSDPASYPVADTASAGNLAVPAGSAAATRVAQALGATAQPAI